jgi:hypothetical protein
MAVADKEPDDEVVDIATQLLDDGSPIPSKMVGDEHEGKDLIKSMESALAIYIPPRSTMGSAVEELSDGQIIAVASGEDYVQPADEEE